MIENNNNNINGNYMTNAKKQKNESSNKKSIVDAVFTVADVARDLNIDPKRARAFLRKNDALYTMRKTKFTKSSSLYKQCVDALTQYKNKNKIVTA